VERVTCWTVTADPAETRSMIRALREEGAPTGYAAGDMTRMSTV
jgi:hypothetical protein